MREIEEYTKLMGESRAGDRRMVARARTRGANVAVHVRSSTSYIMSNASGILAFGEAVVVEPGL